MLRLPAQRGVRTATGRVARRGLTACGGVGDAGGIPGGGGKQGPGARQEWVPGSGGCLWGRVSGLDDRVAGLSKDMADFKGDVNRGLGALAARMDAGFGRMEKNHGELRADIKTLVWQVRILLGAGSLVVGFLAKTYLDEQPTVSKEQADVMPQPLSGPAAVAIAQTIEPKN